MWAIIDPRDSENDQCSLRFVAVSLRSQVSDLILKTAFGRMGCSGRVQSGAGEQWQGAGEALSLLMAVQ